MSAGHVAYPHRVLGVALLLKQAPTRALHEQERAVQLPGTHEIQAVTIVRSMGLRTAEFYTVYVAMGGLDLPLFISRIEASGAGRLGRHCLVKHIGNPNNDSRRGRVVGVYESLGHASKAGNSFPSCRENISFAN